MAWDGAWSNQLLNLIVLSAAQKGFSGFFVYSPYPGPGNLIGSWAAAAGVDQFGNAYPAGLSVEVGSISGIVITGSTFEGTDFIINSSGEFFYSGTPAAGNLVESTASAGGTDSHGNNYVAGQASYGANFATSLNAGFVGFYTGSLAGGWTFTAQVETDAGGDLILSTAGGTLTLAAAGAVTMTGAVQAQSFTSLGDTSVEGTLFVGGSSDTSTNGLTNGQIAGTSGAQSAGTAHTHGPGSYAVTNGQHFHAL
jgi:hypothetical protein